MEHTPKNVAAPSDDSVNVGTRRWRAPVRSTSEFTSIKNGRLTYTQECEEYDEKLPVPKYPYTSAGDIFSIGQSMWSLMSRRYPEQYRFDNDIGPRLFPESAKAFYPQRMQNLVYSCLQSKPNDRIAAEKLWQEIQDEVASFKGLRNLPLKSRGLVGGETLLLKPDKYKSWAV